MTRIRKNILALLIIAADAIWVTISLIKGHKAAAGLVAGSCVLLLFFIVITPTKRTERKGNGNRR